MDSVSLAVGAIVVLIVTAVLQLMKDNKKVDNVLTKEKLQAAREVARLEVELAELTSDIEYDRERARLLELRDKFRLVLNDRDPDDGA
ncbi:MAG: hypothetical protein DRN03_06630 [Thermoplasmata archaeon]|nr:MAG: hypothetical protein DRN03_06630 [Thermoplasmata archaeon]